MESIAYFAWISLTVSLGLVMSYRQSSKEAFPSDLYFQITGWLLFSIPVGARLFHVVYEEPEYYWENPWRILEIWRGGFVYYGGLLGAIIFSVIFFNIRQRQKDFWVCSDLLTPALCLGTGLGRFACFLQGCCYGKSWEGLWSVGHRHPTQLYLLFWEMLLFLSLNFWKKKSTRPTGVLFLTWILFSALGRFLVEFYREDFRGKNLGLFSISQVLALVIVATSLYFLIQRKTRLLSSAQQ